MSEKVNQKISHADELFFVVDEHDKPLAPLPRRLVHGHGVWHRVSHIWIMNGQGNILCHQRSLHKETSAGFWEPFFGGHLAPDEPYDQGAVRELGEEIGIVMPADKMHLHKIYKRHDPRAGYNNEFQAIFVVPWNGDIASLRFDDGEVQQVAWKMLADVEQSIRNYGGKSWTFCGYELDLINELKKRGPQ